MHDTIQCLYKAIYESTNIKPSTLSTFCPRSGEGKGIQELRRNNQEGAGAYKQTGRQTASDIRRHPYSLRPGKGLHQAVQSPLSRLQGNLRLQVITPSRTDSDFLKSEILEVSLDLMHTS